MSNYTTEGQRLRLVGIRCYSAYVFDVDRRANLLTSVESIGSKFGAEQQTGLDRAPFAPGRPEKGILAPRRPPTTPGLANARDSAPLAASTATVLEASATVPAACASISRTTASQKSPPESRRSRLCQGQRNQVLFGAEI